MRLLFLTSEYPPTPGGIATYLGHATGMLARASQQVTVIAPGDAPCDERLADGVRLITLVPLKGVFFRLASRPGLRWLNRLRRPLRKLYTRWRT